MPEEIVTENARAAAPSGPWGWREFGAGYVLIADHGRRDVVLSSSGGQFLYTRNAGGRLEPITPAHPVAQQLAAVPDLLQALREVAGDCYVLEGTRRSDDGPRCRFCDEREGDPHDVDCTMVLVNIALAKAAARS